MYATEGSLRASSPKPECRSSRPNRCQQIHCLARGPTQSPAGGDCRSKGRFTTSSQSDRSGLPTSDVALKLPQSLTEALSGTDAAALRSHTLIEGASNGALKRFCRHRKPTITYFNIKSPGPAADQLALAFQMHIGVGGSSRNPNLVPPALGRRRHELRSNSAKANRGRNYTTPIGTAECGRSHSNPVRVTQSNEGPDTPDALNRGTEPAPMNPDPTQLDTLGKRRASVCPEASRSTRRPPAGPRSVGHADRIGVGTKTRVNCPEGSDLGRQPDVPGLPAGALKRQPYLGGPASGPIPNPPTTLYLAAAIGTLWA